MSAAAYTGRLAPSPTGALHIGNARTFMVAWLRARSLGGRILMRIEDLDHPHNKPGAAEQALEDLRWLGFDWDGGETVQSSRRAVYREACARLSADGSIYPCVCSRADVERAQSAPHAGEQLYYPGTCRGRFRTWDEAAAFCAPRVPLWRFSTAAPGGTVSFTDNFAGPRSVDVARTLGDFPVARDRDGAGYMLASVVDDHLQGVTEIVRGDDLLQATAPQTMIARALGFAFPETFHVPLAVGENGMRLAKRHGDTRIASFRAAGARPEDVVGFLAASCGLLPEPAPCRLCELVPLFDPARIPRKPFVWRGTDGTSVRDALRYATRYM